MTTTAVNCGSNIRSQPVYIDVYGSSEFYFDIDIGLDCTKWISENTELKSQDAETIILEIFNDVCSFSVSCIVNETLTCRAGDIDIVSLMYVYVCVAKCVASQATRSACCMPQKVPVSCHKKCPFPCQEMAVIITDTLQYYPGKL